MMNEYWGERYDLMYYNYVRYFVRVIGAKAKSLIDIGSNGAEYVTWFPWIPDVTSLDLNRPYSGDGVASIKADFFKWVPERQYDLALCLQVLEHLDRPAEFLHKVLEISRKAIISVPYQWPEGASKYHVQDPIDLEKFVGWAGVKPNYYQIVTEPFKDIYSNSASRLIAYFDVADPERNVRGGDVKARRAQTL
jgi:hypothetical protein